MTGEGGGDGGSERAGVMERGMVLVTAGYPRRGAGMTGSFGGGAPSLFPRSRESCGGAWAVARGRFPLGGGNDGIFAGG